MDDEEGQRPIRIRPGPHQLHREDGRIIASGAGSADVFTFVANPYDLLPVARVFRRDELAPESERDRMYQRALRADKLRKIRAVLRNNPRFMFPNGILLVLAADCEYRGGNLEIPDRYGSVIVIDGQHRLFSYADPEVEAVCRRLAKVPVMAALFDTEGQDEVRRSAAATFIEINANQTKIAKAHIDEIGYSILGKNDPRYLAAETLLRLNRRANGPLNNRLRTGFHNEGHIPLTTVTTALARLTNLGRLSRACRARRGVGRILWQGVQNLLELSQDDVAAPGVLVARLEVALDRYYKAIRRRFKTDWNNLTSPDQTTIGFAVVQAALIGLFDRFAAAGLDWPGVEARLDTLQTYLERRAGEPTASACVFRPEDADLPNQRRKVRENLELLASYSLPAGDG